MKGFSSANSHNISHLVGATLWNFQFLASKCSANNVLSVLGEKCKSALDLINTKIALSVSVYCRQNLFYLYHKMYKYFTVNPSFRGAVWDAEFESYDVVFELGNVEYKQPDYNLIMSYSKSAIAITNLEMRDSNMGQCSLCCSWRTWGAGSCWCRCATSPPRAGSPWWSSRPGISPKWTSPDSQVNQTTFFSLIMIF